MKTTVRTLSVPLLLGPVPSVHPLPSELSCPRDARDPSREACGARSCRLVSWLQDKERLGKQLKLRAEKEEKEKLKEEARRAKEEARKKREEEKELKEKERREKREKDEKEKAEKQRLKEERRRERQEALE